MVSFWHAWFGILLISLPAGARTLEVGIGKTYSLPSQAAAAAQNGDHVFINAGRYVDCAVWRQDDLVIEGAPDGITTISGPACQGKALFIISGNNVTVRNVVLTGVRVPDGNGAGIRAEGRNLLVERVRFIENENGILTGNQSQGALIVRSSEFTGNGSCERDCAHGIYAGRLALLRVEDSVFRETQAGHHIKSRASHTEILRNDISDGSQGTASYLIDAPNGGNILIQNNRMQKGPNSRNRSAAISIGSEGTNQPTHEIRIEENQFDSENSYSTFFVANFSSSPVILRGNQLRGRIRQIRGAGYHQINRARTSH
jgi:hypothetical protein